MLANDSLMVKIYKWLENDEFIKDNVGFSKKPRT